LAYNSRTMSPSRIRGIYIVGVMVIVVVTVAAWLALGRASVLRDIDGVSHGSLEKPQSRWNVLFFLTSDCPIGNQYAPEIRRICDAYEPKGAKCFLVYADASMTPVQISANSRDYFHSTVPAILDDGYRLARKAGATVSSEVAVFSPGAELKYRGRINDFYADLGTPRQHVLHHDLRDALDALAAGKTIPNPRTQAIGCFIPDNNVSKGGSL